MHADDLLEATDLHQYKRVSQPVHWKEKDQDQDQDMEGLKYFISHQALKEKRTDVVFNAAITLT